MAFHLSSRFHCEKPLYMIKFYFHSFTVEITLIAIAIAIALCPLTEIAITIEYNDYTTTSTPTFPKLLMAFIFSPYLFLSRNFIDVMQW